MNQIPNLDLFSMGDSDLLPSEQRRRLSEHLRCSTIEEENEFLGSQKSSIPQHLETLDGNESHAISSKASSTRRTSILTELFARSSTSDSFIEKISNLQSSWH